MKTLQCQSVCIYVCVCIYTYTHVCKLFAVRFYSILNYTLHFVHEIWSVSQLGTVSTTKEYLAMCEGSCEASPCAWEILLASSGHGLGMLNILKYCVCTIKHFLTKNVNFAHPILRSI